MGGSKVKICKCGHDRKSHKKNPDSKLSSATFCRDCHCNNYLNRERPRKSDVAVTIFSVIMFCAITVVIVFTIIELGSIVTPIADQQVSMTNGDFYALIQFFLVIMLVLFSSWFVIDPISTDYYDKKRPKFPIDDKNE